MPRLLAAAEPAQCWPMSTRGQLGPGLYDITLESYKWELVSQCPSFSGASAPPGTAELWQQGQGREQTNVLNSLPGLAQPSEITAALGLSLL